MIGRNLVRSVWGCQEIFGFYSCCVVVVLIILFEFWPWSQALLLQWELRRVVTSRIGTNYMLLRSSLIVDRSWDILGMMIGRPWRILLPWVWELQEPEQRIGFAVDIPFVVGRLLGSLVNLPRRIHCSLHRATATNARCSTYLDTHLRRSLMPHYRKYHRSTRSHILPHYCTCMKTCSFEQVIAKLPSSSAFFFVNSFLFLFCFRCYVPIGWMKVLLEGFRSVSGLLAWPGCWKKQGIYRMKQGIDRPTPNCSLQNENSWQMKYNHNSFSRKTYGKYVLFKRLGFWSEPGGKCTKRTHSFSENNELFLTCARSFGSRLIFIGKLFDRRAKEHTWTKSTSTQPITHVAPHLGDCTALFC